MFPGDTGVSISTSQLDKLDLSRVEHFGLGESKELVNLDFLQRMPQLQHLNINSCWNIRYHLSGLRFATKLRVLKISDIVPDEVSRF